MSNIDYLSQQMSVLMPGIARRILFDFFNEVDIPQSQILTIMALYEESPVRLSKLSQRMNVSAPTITGLIDRLEKSGYVKRVPDKEDRRAINVELTKKGHDIALKFTKTIAGKWREIFSQLNDVEIERFVNIAQKIRNSLV